MKSLKFVFMFVLLILAVAVSGVLAVTPSRSTTTTTLGVASVENDQDYTVKKLVSIQVSGVLPVISTGTVSHVQDGITNSVGTITTASGAGSLSATSTLYVFKSGELAISGLGTNSGASVRIVFENYP